MTQEAIQERNELEKELVQKYNLTNYPIIPEILTLDQYNQLIDDLNSLRWFQVKTNPIVINGVTQPQVAPTDIYPEDVDLLEKIFSRLTEITEYLKTLNNLDKNKFEGFLVIQSIFKHFNVKVWGTASENILQTWMNSCDSEVGHILAVIFGDMEPAFLNGGIFDVPN